jgi:hypothetical protein
MALERPEQGYVWLRVPLEGDVHVTIVGAIHTWWSHWHRPPGGRTQQAVRCVRSVGVACAWCDAGFERRARYVLPVRVDGELRVLELGRVQYSNLSLVANSPDGEVGAKLRLWRPYRARNAEIMVMPCGREHVSEEARVDLTDYVSQLGLTQLKMLTAPKTDSPNPSRTAEQREINPRAAHP